MKDKLLNMPFLGLCFQTAISRIRKTATDNKGAALIVVLSFLVLTALITSSVVVISQISSKSLKVNTDRAYAAYLAEGAAARLQWLIMADLAKHTDRNFNNFISDSDDEQVRYLADGKSRRINYYDSKVNTKIYDMASGFNVSTANPSRNLKSLQNIYFNDPDKKDEFKIFLDRLTDYVDRNDFIQLNGMEKSDYLDLNIPHLPRNNKMEYREEILFIPGAQQFFSPDKYGRLSIFNIIPPKGLPKYKSKNNFFSADKDMIMAKAHVDQEEAEDIIRNRNKWLNSTDSFSDFFEPDTIGKLKKAFSFKESGYYTLIVNASPGKGMAARTIILSLKVGKTMKNQGNQYYQYVIY